jgi:hypothetical protein
MQNRDLIETIIQLVEVECILLFSLPTFRIPRRHELFAVHVVSGNVPVVYVVLKPAAEIELVTAAGSVSRHARRTQSQTTLTSEV